jgi:hypothetical protein
LPVRTGSHHGTRIFFLMRRLSILSLFGLFRNRGL